VAKLKINRGTNYNITVNYKVNDVATTLVGATLFFTMKTGEWDTDLTDATASFSVTKTTYTATGDDAANGVGVIGLVPTDTQSLTPGAYYYDIKVKNAAGEIYKLDEGIILLDGSPTNREV